MMSMSAAIAACGFFADDEGEELLNERLGGETTAFTSNRNAFSFSARNLTNDERRTFEVGDSFFEQNWVTAPASTDARDGLGPTFNAQSCSSCHVLDGRAKPPENDDDPERGLLLRISVPGIGEHGAPLGDPVYGNQIQDRSIIGVPHEALISIAYEEIEGTFDDGEPYTLLDPTYSIVELAFGEHAKDLMTSPRLAPAVIGMGLLEAIDEADILALADPDDADADDISGRANMVWDIKKQETVLGRFGWKANEPTVEQQAAGAFLGDIGITTQINPFENCPDIQIECASAPNGGSPEAPTERLGKVAFYVQTIAVPAMRNIDDPQVRRGAEVFLATGCAECHHPSYQTGEHEVAALSNQTIFPFTDLLLHDMGEGLADGRPDFLADGGEWRTPPLWGIGLVKTVNGHTRFLHDGRARNLVEAILWHSGEAERSKDTFKQLSKEDREALISFLRSL